MRITVRCWAYVTVDGDIMLREDMDNIWGDQEFHSNMYFSRKLNMLGCNTEKGSEMAM